MDKGHIAVAPDLPRCSAFGETQQEALTELQSAIAAWIEAARAAGNPVPEPSHPAVEDSFSGKILVRMPKSLHAQIAKQAKREDVSLNKYTAFLLTFAITQRTVQYNLSNYYKMDVISTWAKLPWKPQISDKILIVSDFRTVNPDLESTYIQTTKKALRLSSEIR